MFGPGTLFGRASAFLNLTPGERAFLRFVEGLGAAAVIAGLQAVMPLLASGDPSTINWASVEHTALTAGLTAAGLALSHYFKSFGDPPLPTALPTPAAAPAVPAAPDTSAAAAAVTLPQVVDGPDGPTAYVGGAGPAGAGSAS